MSSLKVFNDMLRTNHLAFCSSIYSYGRLKKDGSPDSKKKNPVIHIIYNIYINKLLTEKKMCYWHLGPCYKLKDLSKHNEISVDKKSQNLHMFVRQTESFHITFDCYFKEVVTWNNSNANHPKTTWI